MRGGAPGTRATAPGSEKTSANRNGASLFIQAIVPGAYRGFDGRPAPSERALGPLESVVSCLYGPGRQQGGLK